MGNICDINDRDWIKVLKELDDRLIIAKKDRITYNEVWRRIPDTQITDELYSAIVCKETSEGFYIGMKFALDMLISHGFENGLRFETNKDGKHHLICLGNYEDE